MGCLVVLLATTQAQGDAQEAFKGRWIVHFVNEQGLDEAGIDESGLFRELIEISCQ